MLYPFGGVYPKVAKDVFIADGARIAGDVTISSGSSVWYNAVIRGDVAPIVIGSKCHIQDNCVCHTDDGASIVLKGDVIVGHGAILHGCQVGRNVLIGMSSILLTGAVIGDNCIIGAGTLIHENEVVASGSLVLRSSGKVVRKLTEGKISYIKEGAAYYTALARKYFNAQSK
ncbi:MAG: gamma carbonic anhydrase family protein [Deltaproteobacteria bacterium]|nr:gamma carbonic anhydrase family protein [Deltaproteobacteria bacterium]